MIIIIRALPQWGKDDGDHDSPTSLDETPDEIREKIKEAKEAQIKNERKSEKGQCYYPFSTLVLQNSTMIFMIESFLFYHFHILVGIFHYITWLVYSNDGLPQNALGLREQASWMHTHLVFILSFHTLIALSAFVEWKSLLLALISIDGHLHSPLVHY